MKSILLLAVVFSTTVLLSTGCSTCHCGSGSCTKPAATTMSGCDGSCCKDAATCTKCCGDADGCKKCCKKS